MFPENDSAIPQMSGQAGQPPVGTGVAVYFGCLCLRMLPVLDRVVARILELDPQVEVLHPRWQLNLIQQLRTAYGGLFAFHGRLARNLSARITLLPH